MNNRIADAYKKVQPSPVYQGMFCGKTDKSCPHLRDDIKGTRCVLHDEPVERDILDGVVQYLRCWNCRPRKAKPAPAPLPSYTFDSHTHALKFIAASLTDLGGEQEALDTVCAHISDLTRRLAEAEAENGRFAGMLEDSVSGWRKLYTEERAERVRIEGVLLNDVQAERQESDEHIKGLVTVIKTQDKNIGDLKAHIQRIGVDHDDVEARAEAAEARVRELEAKKDAAFWQGWSLLAGFIAGFHDEPSLVEEAAREHGVTLGLLEASGCDEFELEPLRKRVFMSAALTECEEVGRG